MQSSQGKIESTCLQRSPAAAASRRKVPKSREHMPTLLSSAVPATLRVSLAALVVVGLAHAEGIERPRHSVQPSWVVHLALDGTPHEGVLGTAQDVDYYRVEVTELTELVIDSESELDIEGALFDSQGRQMTQDDDSGEGRNFRIVAFLRAGDYFLRIRHFTSGARTGAGGRYLLRATGRRCHPLRLALDGSTTEGVIEPEEDADYFRIEVTELTEAAVYTSGGSTRSGQCSTPRVA